jgi:hypothetical protein
MGRRDAASQQSRGWRGLPVLAVAAAFCLSGCASISQKFAESASQLPEVGLSANAPARPVQQMAYPAVHDVPPPRTATMLTDIEQQKLETDLVSARDQQQTAVGIPVAERKKAAKDKAAKEQAAKDQAAKDKAAKLQAARGGGDRSQSGEPAPISASSSRTIY